MNQLENLQQIDRTQQIDGWAVRFYFWSRCPRLLCGFAAVVLVIALALAWFFRAPEPSQEEAGAQTLRAELGQPAPDLEKVLALLGRNAAHAWEGEQWIAESQLPAAGKLVAAAFRDSLVQWPVEPSADLLYYAHYVRPIPHANELVGDLHLAAHGPDAALGYYEREVKAAGTLSAQRKLFCLLLERRDFAAARRLADDPAVGAQLSPAERVQLVVGERRWREVFPALLEVEKGHLQRVPVALAALAGLLWFTIALQAIQPPRWLCFRTLAPVLAVAAGMLSVAPTLLAVLYEEEVWGLKATGDFLDDLIYYVAGVGPREELCKLLCFLPFVPVLMLRKSRLEMLMIAGCVGLGFAIAENVQYFAQAGPAIAFGRFLTANFFHLAATGIIGLAFCDWLLAPAKNFLPFLGKTLAVMLAHGCYDAFMAVPDLVALALVSVMSFMLLALFFFRTLRLLRDPATDQIAISATLIVGISLLNATVLVCASRQLGFEPALICLGFTAFSLVMVTYMFYWQLGEGLSHAAAEEFSTSRPFALA